jgi:alkanesulfonate monooxygenase
LLMRGFNPMQDAIEYGRELVPLVRAEVARRDRATAAVEATPRR